MQVREEAVTSPSIRQGVRPPMRIVGLGITSEPLPNVPVTVTVHCEETLATVAADRIGVTMRLYANVQGDAVHVAATPCTLSAMAAFDELVRTAATGVVHDTCELLTDVTRQRALPMDTSRSPTRDENPSPIIISDVPPATEPDAGEKERI